jgi:hypothetical protein
VDDGILSGPIDMLADHRAPKRVQYRKIPAQRGLVVEYRSLGTTGAITTFNPQRVTIRDRHGKDHTFRPAPGAFSIDGTPIELVSPAPAKPAEPSRTASGSIALDNVPARMARASRIYVEGIHDAELLEKVWGDDLRIEGVVVEQMEGMDDLGYLVRSFQPREGRRLGILLDHLVPGSKESRAAAEVDHPDVLILGHPYVDIWEAVKPSVAGIEAWPEVPRGTEWKQGVLDRLGRTEHTSVFWKELLGRVSTIRDVEPALTRSVEALIDFVAPPPIDD